MVLVLVGAQEQYDSNGIWKGSLMVGGPLVLD